MEKYEWVTWLMFLQTEETLPQNDEELEISQGEFLRYTPIFGLEDDN